MTKEELEDKVKELQTLLKQLVPNWADPIENGLFYFLSYIDGRRL